MYKQFCKKSNNILLLLTFPILLFGLTAFQLYYFSQPPIPKGYTADYFSELNSNLDKLQELRSGIFVHTTTNLETGKTNVWHVNDGQDSMMLFAMPIGEKDKDGYWVYYHQFLSNMPDQAVFTAFEQIVRLSRDSFLGTLYHAPQKYKWSELGSDKLLKIDFKTLQPTGEKIHYLRKSSLSYLAQSVAIKNNNIPKVILSKLKNTHSPSNNFNLITNNNCRTDNYRIRVPNIVLQAHYHFDNEIVNRSTLECWKRLNPLETGIWKQ